MKDVSFKKKLAAYSALSGAFIASVFSAEAQILYTDVIPDDTLNTLPDLGGEWRSLDLNNDGVVDFYLVQAHALFNYRTGEVIGNNLNSATNSVAGIATSTSMGSSQNSMKLPFQLSPYELIDSNLEWVKPNKGVDADFMDGYQDALLNGVFFTSTFYGYWQHGVENGYLGLRINLNGNQYYGWVRLDVDSAAQWMIVKDYAINLTANSSIFAGQCFCPPTGFQEVSDIQNGIFPNPASTRIFISGLNGNESDAVVSIFDVSGRKELTQNVSSIENEIDISSLDDGIYFVELKNKYQARVEKVVVKK
jgi:hypothetical protein